MTDTTATEELFLPEPLPREVKYTVISVDDHVVEPPHTFEGRLPAHLQDRAPRVADENGLQIWEFEDQKFTQVGMNAIAGRKPTQKKEPFRFDQMRPSCYDVDARVRDMDLNGVWAAVNFPSMVTGFCGRVFFNANDPELGQACIRAWNDWLFEEWYTPHPTRIIPLGIVGVEEHPSAEPGDHRREVDRRPHAVDVHVAHACVDVVATRPHLVEAERLLLLRRLATGDRVHADLGELLVLELPDLQPVAVGDARRAVLQVRGEPAFEGVGRFDDVVVDRDHRVLHLPRQRLGKEEVCGALGHV